MKISNNFSC